MPSTPLRRHARSLVRINASPPRLPVAVKAALAMGIPLATAQQLGHLPVGLMASMGVFTILYGPMTPGRFRARLMACVGVGLVACVSLGAVVAGHPVLTVVALVLVAVLATFVCVTLKVGPPGAYFFALVVGVSELGVSHGTPALHMIGATAAGAVVAFCVGMSDLLVWPRRAEQHAVAAARDAVEAYAEADDPVASRLAASRALHAAWTAVSDGGYPERECAALETIQARYAALTAGHAQARLVGAPRVEDGADEGDGVDVPEPWGTVDDDAAEQDVDRPVRVDDTIEQEQLRDSSLGRPRASYLLRQAARWPSETLLVCLRVGLATAAAGGIAVLTERGHAYWAVAFAMLVLHQGGTRESQTVRGLHRAAGTVVGLLVFLGSLALGLSGWGVVVAVMVLQLYVELMVTRNYALAVVGITPLALTIARASAPAAEVQGTVSDRLVDTLVGISCALAVLWLTARRRPELQLRAHARRVVVAVDGVLSDLAEGRVQDEASLERRRHLYHELLESDRVARRAGADARGRLSEFERMARRVSALGYLVIGAAWHPDLRSADLGFRRARAPLARIMASSVRTPRMAASIDEDVRAVEAAIADLPA